MLVYSPQPVPSRRIAILYSYFEKDATQRLNFEFFISNGVLYNYSPTAAPYFYLSASGGACAPCHILTIDAEGPPTDTFPSVGYGSNFVLLKTGVNRGLDFGAHNRTISWMFSNKHLTKYAYFIFLNSSIRGPFVPHYLPQHYYWSDAFISPLQGDVHAAGSSLVCLPERDPGGPGPRLESWAFAVDTEGLAALLTDGVFQIHLEKRDTIMLGEYGITNSMLNRGWNVDTLMLKYRNIDWRDPKNWNCNNNVHPSRHGTYDGISQHPLETIFVKASWGVGEPYISKYMDWFAQYATNTSTQGTFDPKLYSFAITERAQHPPDVKACFQLGNV